MGGDEEIYRELLADFIQGLPEKLKKLQQCCIEGDFEGLSRAAHNLKGVSLNLGALQLSDYARRLEKQADEGYTFPVENLVTELKEISGKLTQNATNFLAVTQREAGYF
jgi:HPt (histidine-containing phosphotransfer) domain-containing protein